MISLTDDVLKEKLERDSLKIPECGCWIWMRGLDKDGYGQASRRAKNIRAHRLSWLLFRGALTEGMVIMHQCDVPQCVNPYHLEQVTQITNNNDKMQKGRHRVASGDQHYLRRNPFARNGDKSSRSKVTESQAIEIRARFIAGALQKELAVDFGITRSAISGIVTRRTFAHI
jgi:HNH endonuclease